MVRAGALWIALALACSVAARPHRRQHNQKLFAALENLEDDISKMFNQEIPADMLAQIETTIASEQHITIGPLPTSRFSGDVAYKLSGPADGQLVILVNGINSWIYRWEPISKFLLSQTTVSYRVLSYDHIGFGFSDPGEGFEFNDAFYLEVLESLLSTLKLNKDDGGARKKAIVIGHSMGGAVSMLFTATHPELVSKLVLLAPAGFQPKPKVVSLLSWMPLFSPIRDKTAKLIASSSAKALLDDFQDPSCPTAQLCANHQTYMWNKRPHVFNTFTLTVHNFHGLFHSAESAATIFQNHIPVLLLVGQFDKTVDRQATLDGLDNVYKQVNADSVYMKSVVQDTKHCFFLEKPREVHRLIKEFIELPVS